jgi:hypothetical protein
MTMNNIDDQIKQLQLQELLLKQEKRKALKELIKALFMLAGSIAFLYMLYHLTF